MADVSIPFPFEFRAFVIHCCCFHWAKVPAILSSPPLTMYRT